MTYRNEFDKGKLFAILLLIIGLFSLLMCASCGVSKKAVDTYSHEVDSSFTTIKKESDLRNYDSVVTKSTDNNKVEEKSDSGSIHLVFDQSSDSAAYSDITIKTDSVGNITINTGGKKLKSLTDTRKRTEKKTEQAKANDSTSVHSSTAIAKSDSSGGKLTETVKSKTIKKTSFQLPWYAYVIGLIALGLIWFFWAQISSARKLAQTVKFPYSNPNDNK